MSVLLALLLSSAAPRVDRIEPLTQGAGCAEFPSFSGETVVYDAFADGGFGLFAMDLKSKRVKRLTQQDQTVWEYWQGWDYAPVVSPDGKRIAYLHEGSDGAELRVIPFAGDSGGDPWIATDVSDIEPQWLGNDAVLAVSRKDELLRFDLPSRTPRVLARVKAPYSAYGMAVFADGEVQLRAETVGGWALLSLPSGATELAPVPIDTKALRFKGGASTADGKSFYHVTGFRLDEAQMVLRPRRGGAAQKVAITTAAMGFHIAPDRQRMVFSSCYEFNTLMRVRDGKTEELLPRSGRYGYSNPAIVDGAVVYTVRDLDERRIARLDLTTHQVTDLGAGAEASGTAQRLAYVKYAGAAPKGIAVGDRLVTQDPADHAPKLARDGTLYFLRGRQLMSEKGVVGNDVDAFAVSPGDAGIVYAAGGKLHQVLANKTTSLPVPKQAYQALAFSLDGREVYAVVGQKELQAISLDGRSRLLSDLGYQGIKEITAAPGGGVIAAVRLWSGNLFIAHGSFP